jgi:uncharacterized repeat protein (TIGR01451 family)
VSGGVNGDWYTGSTLQTSGVYCDSAAYGVGGSAYLKTIPFSTQGYNAVFLSFNHICKLEFFDRGTVEVSPDSGITWIPLCSQYLSHSVFISQSCRFSEASYVEWVPGQNQTPSNSWWKNEVFDLTGILFNSQYAMVRFVLTDMNNNGMGLNGKGWYIDDLIVSDNPGIGSVTGTVYVDSNINAVHDPGESVAMYMPVIDSLSGSISFSNISGEYIKTFFDTSQYEIWSTFNNSIFNVVPSVHAGSITVAGQTDSLRDFAFQPQGVNNDLSISIHPVIPFRSGMDAVYSISYYNAGNSSVQPQVVIYLDSLLTFITATPSPTSVTSDSIVWTPALLDPLNFAVILLRVHVAPIPLNTLVVSDVIINPQAGDAFPQNNTSSNYTQITGSFDPNDITVNRDSIQTNELSSGVTLDYLIRFQNTGNDTAFHVRVLNTIPPELQPVSFKLIASSHPVTLDYHSKISEMVFDFPNILLPDSSTNESASHGYIWYQISPVSSLTSGDSILNSAHIYFDYNAPVTTNTAITQIVLPTGISELPALAADEDLKIFPNPASDHVTMVLNGMEHEAVHVEIYDMLGKQVLTLFDGTVPDDHFTLTGDLTRVTAGMYLLHLRSANQSVQRRLVKY